MINWTENSTKRGAVWMVGAIVAAVFSFYGKDAGQILIITSAVAGGLGVALPDKPQ